MSRAEFSLTEPIPLQAVYLQSTVGQGPTALAVGAGGLDIFTLIYPFFPLDGPI